MRGWSSAGFDVIDRWDCALRADAEDQEVRLFRTDACSVEGVVDEIADHVLEHIRLAGV
jgi:hypothetical protein